MWALLSDKGDRMTSLSRAYRPDIDGLRAVAVLAVVTFHAFPEYIAGGFIGVDVFFVISGFLIAGITLDEAQTSTFSLKRFYARRVRRIFPAMLLVLFTSVLAGWFILLPAELERLGRQVFASAAFVSNFYFWLQSGYFSPDARTFPLLHLWSLGVEEQFYIVWPLIVTGVGRRANWAIYTILLIGLSSFLLNIVIMSNHEADFYLPFTRAWELMLGAALAWLQRTRIILPNRLAAAAAATIGLTLISGSALFLSPQQAYPGWLAIAPTVGAWLILWGGTRRNFVTSLLSLRALVHIGLISYPLYLWHWPLLVFSEALKFAPLTLLERALIVAASFVLAWLTFKYVEGPFKAGLINRITIFTLVVCSGSLAAIGVILIYGQGFDFRFPENSREFAQTIPHPKSWRIHECLIDPKTEATFGNNCLETARPLLFVWGDSTATALMPGLRELQLEENFGLAEFTANSCGPWLDVDIPDNFHCRRTNDSIFKVISSVRPDVVLLHERGYTNPENIDGLKNTVRALRSRSIRTVVLGPDPVWKRGLPNEVMRYLVVFHKLIPIRSSERVYEVWNDTQMRSELTDLGAEYISAWDTMCNPDGCITRLGDRPEDIVALDQSHLTTSGSNFLIQAIKDRIFPLRMPH
jgi:peptidoglycan/LPS O-acetylase OafA/YrhL